MTTDFDEIIEEIIQKEEHTVIRMCKETKRITQFYQKIIQVGEDDVMLIDSGYQRFYRNNLNRNHVIVYKKVIKRDLL